MPATDTDVSAYLQTTLFRVVWLRLAKFLAWLLLTVLGPFRVRGKYRVPQTGGLLVLANHRADVDPVAVQVACPRPVYFMSKSELFTVPILGAMMRAFRAFPVKRGEPDREAIKRAVALLKAGQVVCVFPEGQLTEDGQLQPLKRGVALIARMAGVPWICLGIKNTDRIMPYGKLIPRPAFCWVEANWGEIGDPGLASDADRFIEVVHSQLAELSNHDSVR